EAHRVLGADGSGARCVVLPGVGPAAGAGRPRRPDGRRGPCRGRAAQDGVAGCRRGVVPPRVAAV
ncbi:MAG: hypothetical protein AVDCRST_MAG34-2142, partial [uncultured Nocardioidaceae bacterium]